MNKTLNIVIMVLMAILALFELKIMLTNGFDLYHGVFFLLFSAFAVRRFMRMSQYA